MSRTILILLTVSALGFGQAMVQHAAAAAGGAAAAAGSKKIAEGLDKLLGQTAGATAAAANTPVVAPAPPTIPGKREKPSPFEPKVTRAGGTEMAPTSAPGQPHIPAPAELEGTPAETWVPKYAPSSRPAQSSPFQASPSYDGGPAVRNRGGSHAARAASEVAAEVAPAAPPEVIPVPVVPPPPPAIVPTLELLTGIQTGASYESVLSQLGTPAVKISMYEDGGIVETLRIEARGTKIGTIRMLNGQVTGIDPVAQ